MVRRFIPMLAAVLMGWCTTSAADPAPPAFTPEQMRSDLREIRQDSARYTPRGQFLSR